MLPTDLRNNLFQTLDKAAKGDPVMIEYKGMSLRLEAVTRTSKLPRAQKRTAIIGDPDSIIGSDLELMDLLQKKWAFEVAKLT